VSGKPDKTALKCQENLTPEKLQQTQSYQGFTPLLKLSLYYHYCLVAIRL